MGRGSRSDGGFSEYLRYTPGGGARDRDSRDGYHGEDKQRPVPGLVSDPNTNLREIERAIQRGQRESILRMQSNSGVRPTQDLLAEYHPTVPTVDRPYYRPSVRSTSSSYNKISKRTRINPGFLAFLPGLAGLGLLIAAVVLVTWTEVTSFSDEDDVQIVHHGLFQNCTTANNTRECGVLTQFSDQPVYSRLGQAARGLVIISAAIALITTIACVILGINKCAKSKGSIIVGSMYVLAGLCGAGGMGCYTALLVNLIHLSSGPSHVGPGISIYLGWAGTLFLLIAAVTSYLAHCARPK